MAITIASANLEKLAYQLAHSQGLSVEETLYEGLLSFASQHNFNMNRPPLRERLEKLACEVDHILESTPADTRTSEEILGYEESGIW